MPDNFTTFLDHLCHTKKTRLGIILAPYMLILPHFIQRYDDPFLPYGKAIINATKDNACVYMFDLAAYLSLGAAGAIALERTMRYAEGEGITIVHGPFASTSYVNMFDETGFGAHAVTITPETPYDGFLKRTDRGLFIVHAGSDQSDISPRPDAGIFELRDQTLRIGGITIKLISDHDLFSRAGEDFPGEVQTNMEKLRAKYTL